MNNPFKDLDRNNSELWFNKLKRKRKKGPRMQESDHSNLGISTQCVHSGQYDDPITRAVGTPIYQTSTFYLNEDTYAAIGDGNVRDEMIYTRYGNPSQWSVQDKIAQLENAESTLVFSSGMGAISATILGLVEKGCHVVTSRDLYGGSYNLIYEDLQRFGIESSFVDMTNIKEIENAIQENTKLLFFESLSNPLLKMLPLEEVVQLAKKNGCRLIIDNTFLTPCNLKVLDYGVDLVINSATKYLGGHSDLIAGAVSGSRKLIDQIWPQLLKNGSSMDPHACYLLERSLKTLSIRMNVHNDNAQTLAEFLETQEDIVEEVYYPGLSSYAQKELSESLLKGRCTGMVSFRLKGGNKSAHQFLNALHIAKEATSLGGVESLISLPYNTSQASLTKQQREAIGIKDGVVRMSVGIENIEDIIADVQQGLTKIEIQKEKLCETTLT